MEVVLTLFGLGFGLVFWTVVLLGEAFVDSGKSK